VAIAGLQGTGIIDAGLSLSPASHNFGDVPVGASSAPFHFTLTNLSGATSAMPAVAIGGANATQFWFTTTCTAALSPGATCGIDARFSPNVMGTDTATLTASAGTHIASASLSGQSLGGPPIMVSPVVVDYGTLGVGTSAQRVIVVTNHSTRTTGVPTAQLQGAAASDYAVTATDCTTGLPTRGSCSFTIASTPAAAGDRNAVVTVVAVLGGTASVALTTVGI